MPGATLGDRSTSCLGRHLCQSDNLDDNDDVNDGDNDNGDSGVNDGDNEETAVLVLRQPPDNCQWTSGENSDSPQPGNPRPISHKIKLSNFADARLHAAGRLKCFLLDIFGSADPGRQTQLCPTLSPVCTIVRCKITMSLQNILVEFE